jgi:hypothetical protein
LTTAFAFDADLTLAEICQRLNTRGPWSWVDGGDSAWHGDYIGARAEPHAAIVRIYAEGGGFVLTVAYGRGATSADRNPLRAALFDDLLPALGARRIRPTDSHD